MLSTAVSEAVRRSVRLWNFLCKNEISEGLLAWYVGAP